jgi:hypothetical protein
MSFQRLFGRSALAAVLAAFAAKAGAIVPEKAVSPSVQERVAAIRAKAAELTAAYSQSAAAAAVDRPAQVAWNDWRNE